MMDTIDRRPAVPADPSRAPATRAHGLARLDAFLPHAGRTYAAERNTDRGRHDRYGVSVLSPWVRHRLVTEEEVLRAVLARHTPAAAEKFVQEVFWRTYWKGWLELRPAVWTAYRTGLARQLARLEEDADLRRRLRDAVEGRSGIAAFDSWLSDLMETGYLHNHARMWFASVWIFTLKLPWELGADLFLRHLLDGDPASNTLSWRWVGGLQTRGKTYRADPDNIARYTLGRFRPPPGQLAASAPPLPADVVPEPAALPSRPAPPAGTAAALLLTEEDLGVETMPLDGVAVRAVAGVAAPGLRSPLGCGALPAAFATAALDDGLGRAGARFGTAVERLDAGPDPADAVVRWARGTGLRAVVTGDAPVGPLREALDAVEPALAASGIRLFRARRAWDAASWPHARRGFFAFRERIPAILSGLGIAELGAGCGRAA